MRMKDGSKKRQAVRGAESRLMRPIVALALTCAVAVVLLGLAAGGVDADDMDVDIDRSAFNPAVVTIEVGDEVTWTNTDSVDHTATADDAAWDSGNLDPGESFSHTFTQIGTFDYSCSIHAFTGRVIVVASTSSSTTSSSITTTSVPGTQTFVDVPPGHPYFQAVEGLAGAGIINGYDVAGGLKEFRPANGVLRAQFAKMIVGALGIPVVPNAPIPFVDVDRDANGYPADFVAAAYANNITQGRTATQFAPYVSVLRAQVTTLVVRALEQLHPTVLQDPPAGYQNTWGTGFSSIHGPLARIAEYNGLLGGIPLTGMASAPLTAMPRGEVAQVLWNLLAMVGQ